MSAEQAHLEWISVVDAATKDAISGEALGGLPPSLRNIEAAHRRGRDLDPLALENIHIQQIVIARCGDKVGHGVLEQLHIGPSASYGFKDWFDGAA